MIVEVTWGEFFTEFIGGCTVEDRCIHDGIVGASIKVSGYVLDNL